MTEKRTKRPQPVNWASRIIAAASVLINGTPPLLLEFGLIDWTAPQVAQFQGWVGGVALASIAILLGLNTTKKVTPVTDPRDNALVPLVPIADDGIDD